MPLYLQFLIIYGEIMAQTGKSTARKLWIPFILFVALVPASCASTGGDDKKMLDSLKASVEAFNNAVRWEEYTTAAGFRASGQKRAVLGLCGQG